MRSASVSPPLAPLPPPLSPQITATGVFRPPGASNASDEGSSRKGAGSTASTTPILAAQRVTASGSDGVGGNAPRSGAVLDRLVEQLASAIGTEQQVLATSQDANRRLETSLRDAQAMHREERRQLEQLHAYIQQSKSVLAAASA